MFGLPGQWEWLLILMLGVLLYGRRLPEAGRTLGRTVTEFKRGLREIGESPAPPPGSLPHPLPLTPGRTSAEPGHDGAMATDDGTG